MPFTYQTDPALRPPVTREISWESMVKSAWGVEWGKPETAYKFSNGREFKEYSPPQSQTNE